jgi:hypothetical protein
MACLKNPLSQPNLDISPIWILLIINEMTKSKGSPWHSKFPLVHMLNSSSSVLTLLM